MDNDGDFRRLVDRLVYEATFKFSSFADLVTNLPGIYPIEVLGSLRRTGLLDMISLIGNKQELPNIEAVKLHVPHPLDFDWRFTPQALQLIEEKCLEYSRIGDSIAILGVPSILRATIHKNDRRVVLWDLNGDMVGLSPPSGFEIVTSSITTDPPPALEAAVVVADPPWYPAATYGFLWSASKLCMLGGRIFLSIPPVGTRPGISSEREAVFNWTDNIGLKLESIESGVLPYLSSPFEVNALAAAGAVDVPLDWRRGDLVRFVKSVELTAERPPEHRSGSTDWVEVKIDTVRIRLKAYSNESLSDADLLSVVNGNILPTVSRRDPLRSQADVWTSGNRIFRCENRMALHISLMGLATNTDPVMLCEERLRRELNPDEIRVIKRLNEQLMELVETERLENLAHGYSYE
jgi:hypothetical protein